MAEFLVVAAYPDDEILRCRVNLAKHMDVIQYVERSAYIDTKLRVLSYHDNEI